MPSGQYPSILAGESGVASLIQSLAPLNAYKAADTSRTSTVTLANDPDLSVPVAASAFYLWVMLLDYEGGTQGSSDLKISMSVPTGATARFWMGRKDAAGTNTSSFMGSDSTSYAAGTATAGVLNGLLAVGGLAMSTTPGNFTLQWAQNTSNGVATIVHAKSCLALLRFA